MTERVEDLDLWELEEELGVEYARRLLIHLCQEYGLTVHHTTVNERGDTLSFHTTRSDTSLTIHTVGGTWVAHVKKAGAQEEEYTAKSVHRVALKGFSGLIFFHSMRTAATFLTERAHEGDLS